jgi:TonB-linked SusC/RagA family outer membrane protein
MRKLLFILLGVFVICTQLLAQNRTVSGTVTDNTGKPLLGVSVAVIGTNSGTTTDANGRYSLSVPQNARQLNFSYVGFGARSLAIPANGELSVSLQPGDDAILDQVVITGYARQRRAEYSGAGTKVESQKINLVPSGSIDQILQGRAPGLLVTVGSGQPGSAARVQIRGASSISGGSSPLYVIDGVPVEAGVFQSLNPNDIESVDVLRDASATAIYGNRGGTGVIVITTKKGESGKTAVSYAGQRGITQPGKQQFEMMNSSEILLFQEQMGMQASNGLPGWAFSRKNPANANLPAATLAQYDRNLDSLRAIDVNWADVFQRQGTFQSHDLNFSGGTGKTRFFSSLGYYEEDGIGLRSDMSRYSFRSNVDHQSNKLTASLNAYAGYTLRSFIESEGGVALANPFAAAYLGLPYHALYRPDGSVATGAGRVGPNAFDRINTTTSNNNQFKGNLNINTNYQLTSKVNLGAFLGMDYRETLNERSVYPNSFAALNSGFPVGPLSAGAAAGGSFGESMGRVFSYLTRANAGYRNTFKSLHDIDIQGFVEFTKDYSRSFSYTGYGINSALLNTPAGITPGNITNRWIPGVGGGRSQRSLFATIATAKYTFDRKYTLNLTGRRDASSQLPEDNRWANFYSVGATWNVLRESFASSLKVFDELRVRASYGTSANADNFPIGNFGYLPTYGAINYVGGGQGIIPTNPGSTQATWEQIKTLNLGLDFGMFRNRLRGSLDVYNKTTDNNFVSQSLSLTSGFASAIINAATVENKGVELQLNGDLVRYRDLLITVGGNLAYNHNEVTDLGQVSEFPQGTAIIRVGLPLGSHYVVKWGGVDAATGQPLYYRKDGSITNIFPGDDQLAEFGTFNAPWIGGFNTGIRYKGFSLEAFFTFQQGFSRFNNQDFFQLNHAFAISGYNMRREMATMWKKPGDVTNIQSSLYQRQFSSKDIQDASYVRFRNLNVSYSLPSSLINSTGVFSDAKIFVQAQNLYTWTNWTGFDPEDNNNIAQYEYPTPRTFTLGLNLRFK